MLRTVIFASFFLAALAALAITAAAQVHPFQPSPGELINSQQIQALRAEVMQLRIRLIACQDELAEARKALDLCQKGSAAMEKLENPPETPEVPAAPPSPSPQEGTPADAGHKETK